MTPGSYDTPVAGPSEDKMPQYDIQDQPTSAAASSEEDLIHNESDPASTGNSGNDLLPRDLQHKTPTYDYAYERSMSHAEARLFYQHLQREARDATTDAPQSPVLTGDISTSPTSRVRTGSVNGTSVTNFSDGSGIPSARAPEHPSFKNDYDGSIADGLNESNTAVNRSARNQAMPQKAGQEQTPYMSGAEGAPTSNAGPDATQGAMKFPTSNNAVTSELSVIYRKITGLLDRRAHYIQLSHQGSEENPRDRPEWEIRPPPPEPAWYDDKDPGRAGDSSCTGRKRRKMGQDIGEDFDMEEFMPLPEESSWNFKLDGNSVYQVYKSEDATVSQEPIVQIPSLRDFYMDLDAVLNVSTDGPAKSFAFRRLSYLESKFQLYSLLNEYQEVADSKRVPHRDFYNVRKVDTHVHHSACMNQKHLLRFIKSKMKKSPDEVVLFRDGKHLTLKEVFQSINLTAYDLSIDTLDMHVRESTSLAHDQC